MTRRTAKSPSGYWNVELATKIELAGFNYLPGITHRVDDETLRAMKAHDAEAIDNASPAD